MKTIYALVGMKFFHAESIVAMMPDGEPLTLVREPGNAHDANAVQVWARGVCVGYVGRGRKPDSGSKYVPGHENEPLARRMDAAGEGVNLPARYVAGPSPKIEVEE